jgi:aminoglycoside 3-N-acetyltransferase I
VSAGHATRQLFSADLEAMDSLLRVFGEAFEDLDRYVGSPPDPEYLRALLGGDSFIAVVAEKAGAVVGGIAAYELRKFEQKRSEIYLYDLAVLKAHRRQGVATALIRELGRVAAARGACAIFVQAHSGVEEEAAIALYSKLGAGEEVLHFDIPVPVGGGPRRRSSKSNDT